jgi:hypothetical protein
MNSNPTGFAPLAAAYRVIATRYAAGWELAINTDAHGEVGITSTDDEQPGTGWASADYMVRDWLMTVYELTPRETAAIVIAIEYTD